MIGKGFEVKHLLTLCAELLQQTAFAAARCSANDTQQQTRRQRLQISDDASTRRAIAAFKLPRLPTDASQNMRHRTAAVTAAPAVNERPPRFWHRLKLGFQMKRDVARDVCSAATPRFERGLLAIHRAYFDALGVGEDGAIHRARQVIDCESGLRSHIN